MRPVAIVALTCVLLCPMKGRGQQTTSAQSSQPVFPAQRDPQAVNIASQSLGLAGGSAAFLAISDYTATGTITSSQGQPTQDSVTISGRGANELRKDVSGTDGISSYAVSDVEATSKDANGRIQGSAMQPAMMTGNFALPYRELAAVFSNPQFSLAYLGLTQFGSQSLHHIQAQLVNAGAHDPGGAMLRYHTVDFFIDSTTLQPSVIQDIVPRRGWPRTLTYSDFRTVGGLLVPFQINEVLGGRPSSTIQLNQIAFNSQLPDSMFHLTQ